MIGKQVVHCLKGRKNPVPGLWEEMVRDGSLEFLKNLPNRLTPDPDAVGWMGEYNTDTKEFVYLAGVLVKPGSPVPDGYVYRDIPDCTVSIGWIQGKDAMCRNVHLRSSTATSTMAERAVLRCSRID